MGSKTGTSYDLTLDARDVEGEPFGAIMESLTELSAGETLLLINSFEPEPLYDVLDERGFEFASEEVDADEWHIEITAT